MSGPDLDSHLPRHLRVFAEPHYTCGEPQLQSPPDLRLPDRSLSSRELLPVPKGFFKMKKLLFVLPALLVVAMVGAPNARADSYTVNFACNSPGNGSCPFGAPPTSTDASFPGGNFDVTFVNGLTSVVFDVTLPSTFVPTDTYGWMFSSGAVGGGSVTDALEIVDDTVPLAEFFYVTGSTASLPVFCDQCEDGGSITFSPIAASAPEPAPIILMLLGLGVVFLVGKRFSARLQQAA